ncbi:MAG: PQQ-like beta-propeller repeat protein, partial [Asgard group archaeon]|nr:PQQ-like beta-propeller repeat protein [Asgard group archaeon]
MSRKLIFRNKSMILFCLFILLASANFGKSKLIEDEETDLTTEDVYFNFNWSLFTGYAVDKTPTAANLVGGYREVLITASSLLCCISKDGVSLWNYTAVGTIGNSPAVVDIDHDGQDEIIFACSSGYVYCLSNTGNVEWTRHYSGENFGGAPAIGDLDNDSHVEILLGGFAGAAVYCLNETGHIKWIYDYIDYIYTPTIADINADGYLEVLAADWTGELLCLDYEGDLLWSYGATSLMETTASVADLDDDGKLEVIFGSDDNWLYCVNSTGDLVWKFLLDGDIQTAAAIGDINNDGNLEIVVGTMASRVNCLDENGTSLWNFTSSYALVGAPALCKLSDSGYLHVVINDYYGYIHVLNHLGGETDSKQMPSYTYGSVIALDLENLDYGYTEFLFGCDDGNLYCYTFSMSAVTNNIEWSGLYGSFTRNGRIDSDRDRLDDETENYCDTGPYQRDTDADGLYDYFEIFSTMTSAKDNDTDDDYIDDGDEYYLYNTNPLNNDTDADGLLDGLEVFTYYTEELDPDTDDDGLLDGEEILVYTTNPFLADSDVDGLDDYDEIFTHFTDPSDSDSDDDTINDGDEINTYLTDPLDDD